MNNNNFIKKFFSKYKKLTNEDLNKVTGASDEPEEFVWEDKGYATPIKGKPNNNDWDYEPVGDKDIKDIFKK